jgi:hypothetical protein
MNKCGEKILSYTGKCYDSFNKACKNNNASFKGLYDAVGGSMDKVLFCDTVKKSYQVVKEDKDAW